MVLGLRGGVVLRRRGHRSRARQRRQARFVADLVDANMVCRCCPRIHLCTSCLGNHSVLSVPHQSVAFRHRLQCMGRINVRSPQSATPMYALRWAKHVPEREHREVLGYRRIFASVGPTPVQDRFRPNVARNRPILARLQPNLPRCPISARCGASAALHREDSGAVPKGRIGQIHEARTTKSP